MKVFVPVLLAVATANLGLALFSPRDFYPSRKQLSQHDASLPTESPSLSLTIHTPQVFTAVLSTQLSARDASDDGPPSAAAEGRPGGYRTIPTSASMRARMRTAHGTLMALAFVVFFPLGAIVMHTTHRVWIHAVIQVFAYCTAIAGLGIGVWLGSYVRYLDYAHTVIGMAVLAALLFQLGMGIWAHRVYLSKKAKAHVEKSGVTKKRGMLLSWGHVHRWVGRGLIALGIANGGVGLKLAQNTTAGTIAYGVIAGVVGAGVISLFLVEAWRRHMKKSADSEGVGAQIPES